MRTKSKLKPPPPSTPSSTSFPQAVQGNREWVLQSVHNTFSAASSCHSAPVPCGVPPTGCHPSPSGPVWASHRLQLSKHHSSHEPPFEIYSRMGPHRWQLRPGAVPVGVPMGCGSFMPHPLLHHGLLRGCTRRSALCGTHTESVGAQSAPLWASPGLHGAAAQRLEHLLPSLVPAGLLLSVSYSPLPAAVAQFFPSLTLLSQSTPGVAHGSVVVAAGPCWSSWSWLWSDTGQCWALHTPEIAV